MPASPRLGVGDERGLEVGEHAGGEVEVGVDLRDHVVVLGELLGCPGERLQLGGLGEAVARRRAARALAAPSPRRGSAAKARARPGRGVGRAVVDEQHAVGRPGLGRERREEARQVGLLVEERHDEGDAQGRARGVHDRATAGGALASGGRPRRAVSARRSGGVGERGVDRDAQALEARLHGVARLRRGGDRGPPSPAPAPASSAIRAIASASATGSAGRGRAARSRRRPRCPARRRPRSRRRA